jgi:hypothetical protein
VNVRIFGEKGASFFEGELHWWFVRPDLTRSPGAIPHACREHAYASINMGQFSFDAPLGFFKSAQFSCSGTRQEFWPCELETTLRSLCLGTRKP